MRKHLPKILVASPLHLSELVDPVEHVVHALVPHHLLRRQKEMHRALLGHVHDIQRLRGLHGHGVEVELAVRHPVLLQKFRHLCRLQDALLPVRDQPVAAGEAVQLPPEAAEVGRVLPRVLQQELDVLDEVESVSDGYPHGLVWVVPLPHLLAEDHNLGLAARLPVLVALQDDGDHEVEHHDGDNQRVRYPVDARHDVRPQHRRHAGVGVVDEALVLQHLVTAHLLGSEQAGWSAPGALSKEVHLVFGQVVHELVPGLASGRAEEGDEGPQEVVEVAVDVERLRVLRGREQADAEDAEQRDEQEQDEESVHQLRQCQEQCHKDLVQPFQEAQKAEQTRDAEYADDRGERCELHVGDHPRDDAGRGGHDAQEVEAVPVVLEIIPSKRIDLHGGLEQKDDSEYVVDDLQGILPPVRRRRVDMQCHGERVDRDGKHDRVIERPPRDEPIGPPAQPRQLVQVRQIPHQGRAEQVLPRSDPLLLHPRQLQGALALGPQVHELVHDYADAEVYQEHVAEEQPEHEEGHKDVVLGVALRLDVDVGGVARVVHDVDPALRGRDLEQREQRVPHVVEVLAQALLPLAALLDAEGRVPDERLAVVCAEAGCLALPQARLAARAREVLALVADVDAEVEAPRPRPAAVAARHPALVLRRQRVRPGAERARAADRGGRTRHDTGHVVDCGSPARHHQLPLHGGHVGGAPVLRGHVRLAPALLHAGTVRGGVPGGAGRGDLLRGGEASRAKLLRRRPHVALEEGVAPPHADGRVGARAGPGQRQVVAAVRTGGGVAGAAEGARRPRTP
mmetsp:Transcript_67709/g.192133  ORF Transcript_67709/g.192133 Transcript_67709/m.192133 type:complete len:795 (+) Transcript_67709:212-2596(+)